MGERVVMRWSELEGKKIKRVLGNGDLEFVKQNNLPDAVYLILNDGKGDVEIAAMSSDDPNDPRPWLRLTRSDEEE